MKIVVLLLVTAPLMLSARDLASVVIGYGEWPPFESEALPDLGPLPSLVGEALSKGGTRVVFKNLPWWRMLHELETGQIDGALVWRDVADRRATFLLSDPLFTSRISLFFRKDEVHRWTKLSDLSTVKIGATVSYHYCPEFDQLAEQGRLRVERAAADDLNFAKLKANRVDAMLVDAAYGHWRLAQMGDATEIVEGGQPVCRTPMYLLISRAVDYGPALTERFNAGLRQMKADGRFDQLMGRFEP